jgi:hypothetical protein
VWGLKPLTRSFFESFREPFGTAVDTVCVVCMGACVTVRVYGCACV